MQSNNNNTFIDSNNIIDYTHEMNLIAKFIRGDIKLTNTELWQYIYDCFGALDQIQRMKNNEQVLRDCFNLTFTEHQHTSIKSVPDRTPDGFVKKDANNKTIYVKRESVSKTYSVNITPKRDLSSKDFYHIKNIFNGVDDAEDDE